MLDVKALERVVVLGDICKSQRICGERPLKPRIIRAFAVQGSCATAPFGQVWQGKRQCEAIVESLAAVLTLLQRVPHILRKVCIELDRTFRMIRAVLTGNGELKVLAAHLASLRCIWL